MSQPSELDILSAWAEANAQQTTKLVDLVAAFVLDTVGADRIEFTPEQLGDFARRHRVARTLEDGKWSIKLEVISE